MNLGQDGPQHNLQAAVLEGAWGKKGPFLLEIDMRAIGSFKTTFSGPPVNKLDQIPATTKAQ
ncbi:hypothetical protein [Comamonas thiooxydans]|uniref:hypothetical protein n=1 Tax=Comamonas thiooxydans TaxID=363952 RepID=UPI00325FCB6C